MNRTVIGYVVTLLLGSPVLSVVAPNIHTPPLPGSPWQPGSTRATAAPVRGRTRKARPAMP